MDILEVKNLSIHYETKDGPLMAVDDVSFTIEEGENLGIVGESGCGKTTVIKGILQLLAKNGKVVNGSIKYRGEDLTKLSEEEMRKYRWKEIAMISQSAMNALNPVYRVGNQIKEAVYAHTKLTNNEAQKRAEEVFDIVGLEAKRLKAYPHEMSGGMKQRAIIAMAMVLNPGLIIADEPTTALDVIVQDKILQKIVEIQDEINSSMVFITHDISVVAETCEKVCVMYGGKVMEYGSTKDIFKDSRHPYTLGLRNAFPNISLSQKILISIPGIPPDLVNPPEGCRFYERCPFSDDKCKKEQPPKINVTDEHYLYCHYADQYEKFREESVKAETWEYVKQRQIERGVV